MMLMVPTWLAFILFDFSWFSFRSFINPIENEKLSFFIHNFFDLPFQSIQLCYPLTLTRKSVALVWSFINDTNILTIPTRVEEKKIFKFFNKDIIIPLPQSFLIVLIAQLIVLNYVVFNPIVELGLATVFSLLAPDRQRIRPNTFAVQWWHREPRKITHLHLAHPRLS